jgi:two-component system response regulator
MPNEHVDILLVEDNISDSELILRVLKKTQICQQIDAVRDGAEALDYIFCMGKYKSRSENDLPTFILLDLKLPKVDGLEVLRRIKVESRTRSIPVIIFTSSQEPRDILESYRFGVNSYIVKPVDYADFSTTVQSIANYWLSFNHSSSIKRLYE